MNFAQKIFANLGSATLIALGVIVSFQVNAQGYLRAEGQDIVNGQGDKVILRGMGLGGWMLQEGYMLQLGGLGSGQQYVIRQHIAELIGEEDTQKFYDAWLANHTTKADVDAMARWGFNSIRLPMHYNLYTLPVEQEPVVGKNTWLDKGFEMTDALIAWAKANNMYVILDLHAAPGGQGSDLPISDRDPNKPSLWQSQANRAKTIALWKKLAERYANEPWVGAYDIINEPNWGFAKADDAHGCAEKENKPLRELMVDITNAIREVDQKHMVIIEGNCWGNNYAGILPQWDSNMALSFHKYWNYNRLADIQDKLDMRAKYNIPLWLGESGENSNAWFSDAIRLVESQGIGWSFWPLKKMGFNNPLQVNVNPGYQKILDYWLNKGPKPSAAEAKKALMQLATQDINYAHNLQHLDVVDAMFRLPYLDNNLPFVAHKVTNKLSIAAVDYDMGLSGAAYWDKDSGNYYISTGGERQPWNKGKVYRNDGVDINFDGAKKTYYVDSIESGEWLEYNLDTLKAGSYQINLWVRAKSAGGKVSLRINNQADLISKDIPASEVWQKITLTPTDLQLGSNRLRLKAEQGGYEFLQIDIRKQ